MDFDFSPKVQDLRKQVSQFMEDLRLSEREDV